MSEHLEDKDYGNSWRSHRLLVMDSLQRLDVDQKEHKKDIDTKLDLILKNLQTQEVAAAKSGGIWGATTAFITMVIGGTITYIKSHT